MAELVDFLPDLSSCLEKLNSLKRSLSIHLLYCVRQIEQTWQRTMRQGEERRLDSPQKVEAEEIPSASSLVICLVLTARFVSRSCIEGLSAIKYNEMVVIARRLTSFLLSSRQP